MCPDCTVNALFLVTGLLLTPWRWLIAVLQRFGR